MNILIPDHWLREHLQSTATAEEIQKYLSLCGPSVERIDYQKNTQGEKEAIYDIEVTTNRVDSMSVRGIAREAVTILKRFGLRAKLKDLPLLPIKKEERSALPLPEIIYQTDRVKRVLAVVLDGVEHLPSPQFIQDRLSKVAINVHEAAIDITNYVTHELGHPCHAFDYDKIMARGGKIYIREAQKGQKFVTLDGEEYLTAGGEIVFTDQQGEIIDLPAVKGTLNTGVDDRTKRILFWIESLDAEKVRFASMTHAIRSMAAQLNEKNVDPHLALPTMERGVQFFRQYCRAKVASSVYDYFPAQQKSPLIKIPLAVVDNYLGLELPLAEIRQILTDLACQITVKGSGKRSDITLAVQPPTFRQDIQIKADVVEEVARIYGYHNLPSRLMSGALPEKRPADDFTLEHKVKNFLAALGWQEIYSYSLVSATLARESGHPLDEHLMLANPLKEENTYLRRSLLPSLREIMANNPQAGQLSLFELACLYHPRNKELPQQDLSLALLSKKPYRQVKGELWALLEQLYLFQDKAELQIVDLAQSEFKRTPYRQAAQLKLQQGKRHWLLGQLLIYPDQTVGVEMFWPILQQLAHKYPRYQKIIHTALVKEDLTFTLDKNVAVGELLSTLQNSSPLIKKVELSSIYRQNYTFAIYYQDPQNNIDSQVVSDIRKQLIMAAEKTYHAQLVGQA